MVNLENDKRDRIEWKVRKRFFTLRRSSEMKRKFALLLAAVMASSCFGVTGYGANFKDIHDVPWAGAAEVINSVADKGLFSGYEDGTFRARNNVTYCEAMQMVYKMLLVTGAGTALDATEAYRYTAFMTTYHIPAWAQSAVAYGLSKNIISAADLAKFMSGSGKSNPATREDVAKIFGNAMAVRYDVDGKSASAAQFGDFWQISADAMPLVDLLKRLGIVNGDNTNQFHPKSNINRAEMAVLLNKTYEVLTQGIGNSATVKSITNNAGTYYYIEMEMEDGTIDGFHASPDKVKVYAGDTKQELALSRISKGDKIRFVRNAGALLEIYVLDAMPAQAKYDITGYIDSIKDNTVTLENENTGELDKYMMDSNCVCYVEGVKVARRSLKEELDKHLDVHAYAGLMTEMRRENKEDVFYATEIHVTFTNEYTTTGIVEGINSSRISFKAGGTSAKKDLAFAPGCEYYIGEKKESLSNLIQLSKAGTTYVKVTLNQKNEAIKVIFSEDSFEGNSSGGQNKTYEVVGFSESKLVVKYGGQESTYRFDSENSIKNIAFYKWDDEDKEFTDVKFSAAENYVDKAFNTVYCRLEFNKGGKITGVELSTRKSAWKDNSSHTERKGTVDSITGGVLKFKTSANTYTMLKQYNAAYDSSGDDEWITGDNANGVTVRNPLVITSAATSSLTVFEKMANDADVELYAEITADGNNNVAKINARLTKAVGKLVEYDQDDKIITIETAKGNKFKLNTLKTPKLTNSSDNFTLDDVAGIGYVGSKLELGFNNDGLVNKITVTGSAYSDGVKRVKGTAVSAYNGLQVEGSTDTFRWLDRKTIEVKNHSGQSTSLDVLQDLIEDNDVTVYVEAALDERERVSSIDVYVKKATGTLTEYNDSKHVVRIITSNGKKFTFDSISKPQCNVSGLTLATLDEKGRGKNVELSFNQDGWVSGIVGK